MRFEKLRRHWDTFGKTDPMWAVLTDPAKRHNKWEPEEFFRTGKVEIEAAMARVRDLGLTINIQGRALDFGCGIGRLTQALAPHFKNVVGVDVADSMIERAKKFNLHGDRCTYVVNAAENLEQFESESFNFIYCHVVLQHMKPEYSTRYIAEFLRLLARGGIAMFDIPAENIEVDAPSFRAHFRGAVARAANLVCSPIMRRPFFPIIEMYAVPKSKIEQLVFAGGGTIVEGKEDLSAGSTWPGYSYVVTK